MLIDTYEFVAVGILDLKIILIANKLLAQILKTMKVFY